MKRVNKAEIKVSRNLTWSSTKQWCLNFVSQTEGQLAWSADGGSHGTIQESQSEQLSLFCVLEKLTSHSSLSL